MRNKLTLIFFATALLLSACTATISESAVQTAVAQIMLTAEAENPQAEPEAQPEPQVDPALQEELDQAKQQLQEAQTKLAEAEAKVAEQAAQIAALQEDANQAEVEEQAPAADDSSPTPTITSSPTPSPTVYSTPHYQKAVIAKGNAPLWYYKKENDAGKPIMIKTNPIIRYEKGDEFLVNRYVVFADGGNEFYEVIGPKGAGYYVLTNDVKDR